MSLVREESDPKPVYDLEELTARFGEMVVDFARTIPHDPVTDRIISQLVGAGTSIGANYVEADDSVSKREFLKRVGTCKKEPRETKYFLRMAVRAVPKLKPEARKLWREAREVALHLCENLAERETTRTGKITKLEARMFRHLSLVLPSSFVIRASSFS
jgi:four helix bundle protein